MSPRKKPTKSSETKPEDEESFEDGLQRLQQIVAKLEEGDLPLLESIESYRDGIDVLHRCRKMLDEARQTVEVLTLEAQKDLEALVENGERDVEEDEFEDDELEDEE